MHTKQVAEKLNRRHKTVTFSPEESKKDKILYLSDFQKKIEKTNFVENWLDEEERRRLHPAIKRLTSSINTLLIQDSDLIVSFCPDLPRRISDEIVRVSCEEPGGVAAGRVKIYLRSKEGWPASADDGFSLESSEGLCSTSFCLGTVGLTEKNTVETFEVDVFLFPSNSVLSRLQTIITNLSLSKEGKFNRFRSISLLPDFVLVKRKLFRSSSKKPLIVIKSLAK